MFYRENDDAPWILGVHTMTPPYVQTNPAVKTHGFVHHPKMDGFSHQNGGFTAKNGGHHPERVDV